MSKLVTINFHKPFVVRLGAQNFFLKIILNDMLDDPHIELWIRQKPHEGYVQISLKGNSGFVNHFSQRRLININNYLPDASLFFCKQIKSNDPNIKKFRVRENSHFDDIYDDYDGYDLTFALSALHDSKTGRVAKSRSLTTARTAYRNRVTSLTNKQRKKAYFRNNIDPQKLLQPIKSKFSLDHKVSVHYGFKNDIDEELIASMANLEVLTKRENGRKGIGCSMTIGALLKEHERLKGIE